MDDLDALLQNLDNISALEEDLSKHLNEEAELDDILDDVIEERSQIIRSSMKFNGPQGAAAATPDSSSGPSGYGTLSKKDDIRSFQEDFSLSEDNDALLDNMLSNLEANNDLPPVSFAMPATPKGESEGYAEKGEEKERDDDLSSTSKIVGYPQAPAVPPAYEDPLEALYDPTRQFKPSAKVYVDEDLGDLLSQLNVSAEGEPPSDSVASTTSSAPQPAQPVPKPSAKPATASTAPSQPASRPVSQYVAPKPQAKAAAVAAEAPKQTSQDVENELDKMLDQLEAEGTVDKLREEMLESEKPAEKAAGDIPMNPAAARAREFDEWAKKFDASRSNSSAGAGGLDSSIPQGLPGAPPCAKCSRPLGTHVTSTALGRFHPGCWKCETCSTSLQSGRFQIIDYKAYCQNCSNQVFAQRCARCDMPVSGAKVLAFGKSYHPQCFLCDVCNADLTCGYVPIQGKALCGRCFQGHGGQLNATSASRVCQGCHGPIRPDEEGLQAGQYSYHKRCFICRNCQLPIASSFYFHGGYPYCDKYQCRAH